MSGGPTYRLDVRFAGGATLALGMFDEHQDALDTIENLFALLVASYLAARTGLTFASEVRSADSVVVLCTDNRKKYNPTGLHCVFSIVDISGSKEKLQPATA